MLRIGKRDDVYENASLVLSCSRIVRRFDGGRSLGNP